LSWIDHRASSNAIKLLILSEDEKVYIVPKFNEMTSRYNIDETSTQCTRRNYSLDFDVSCSCRLTSGRAQLSETRHDVVGLRGAGMELSVKVHLSRRYYVTRGVVWWRMGVAGPSSDHALLVIAVTRPLCFNHLDHIHYSVSIVQRLDWWSQYYYYCCCCWSRRRHIAICDDYIYNENCSSFVSYDWRINKLLWCFDSFFANASCPLFMRVLSFNISTPWNELQSAAECKN